MLWKGKVKVKKHGSLYDKSGPSFKLKWMMGKEMWQRVFQLGRVQLTLEPVTSEHSVLHCSSLDQTNFLAEGS